MDCINPPSLAETKLVVETLVIATTRDSAL